MKWISLEDKIPRCCEDILFTEGKRIYIGWLETYEPLEDLCFTRAVHPGSRECGWIDGITHYESTPCEMFFA